MNNQSLSHIYMQMQQETSWNDAKVQFKDNQVLCPMCEMWHENNTLCQQRNV